MKKFSTILVFALIASLTVPVIAQPRVFMAYDGENGKMCAVARNNNMPFNAVVTYRQSNPGGMIGEITEYWPASTWLWAEAPVSPIDPNRLWDVPDGALNIIQTQVDYYDRNSNEFLFTEYAYDTLVAEVEGNQGRYIYDNGCSSVLPDSIPCPRTGGWSFCAFICHGTYVIPICCESPGYDPNRLEVTVQNGCGPYTRCNSDPDCPQIDWNLFTWYKRVFPGCRLYLVMTYCNGNPGCICIWRSDFYLPVEINSFSAVPGDRQVSINWTVASETDVHEYRITRSETRVDGYVTVGTVPARNAAGSASYSFVDDRVMNGTTYYYKLHVVDADGNHVYNDGNEAVVVEATPGSEIPAEYSLSQNYPNPFNATTTFSFGLPASEHVSLKVFDLMGREVATVVNGQMTAGSHTVNWTADGMATGVYMYKMTAGNYSATKKLLLVK